MLISPLENAFFSTFSDISRLKVVFPRGENQGILTFLRSGPMENYGFSDEFSMKSDANFAEILEKINESSHTTDPSADYTTGYAANYTAGWESSLDPSGLAQIIGFVPVFKTGHKKYKPTPPAPARVRIPHVMNLAQTLAFENLSLWSPQLSPGFTRIELKSCYRFALLKTHPDQGGTSESFFQIKKSYEILSSLVKS